MCGIHLIWGKNASRDAIQTLLQNSRHRGPDQESLFSPWPGLWVGVNRLKIIHLGSEANQPMWSPDQRYLLIWNGELYNHQELRQILMDRGLEFKSSSDTEVLLQHLSCFGEAGLPDLKGMFAFIWIDTQEHSILVARDSNGERPLYFCRETGTLILSSESRGISQLINAGLDKEQLAHYCYFRAPLPGKTYLEGIEQWKPGHFSLLKSPLLASSGQIMPTARHIISPGFEDFRKSLDQAVLNQFHADVPIGMMLSGGADSSLLYALQYRLRGVPLPAFTVQVEKKYRAKYADGNAASKLCRQIPAMHQVVEIDQAVFLDHWDEYVDSVDLPIGDSAGFLTWVIGKKAKGEVKVLVSGAGADELWGGYYRHRAFYQYLEQQASWVKLAPWLGRFPLGRAWKKLMKGIDPDPKMTFINFSALQNPPFFFMKAYLEWIGAVGDEYKAALDFDRQVYLVEDVLKIQDQALMAHSIEGRSPYLDADLLGLWRIVKDRRLLLGKPWIRRYLSELGLDWINQREKFGFGLPLLEWLSEDGPVSKRIFSTLKEFSCIHPYLLSPELRSLCEKPESGVKAHFLTLYNLFLLAEWLNLRRL